jgi:hypothetical protein
MKATVCLALNYPYIPLPLEIEDGKAADISNSVNVNSELSEKIHNLLTAICQTQTQHQGCQDQAHKFHEEQHRVVLEKQGKAFSDLNSIGK